MRLAVLQLESASLRSNELMDLQTRMGAAMQRIAELEAVTQRGGHPSGARPNSNDDTRAVIRDNKFRRTPRMSPHGSSRSPGADPYLYGGGSAAAAASADNVKLRTRQVRLELCKHTALSKHISIPTAYGMYCLLHVVLFVSLCCSTACCT